MKHDVFISYSRKDSDIADKIYETLTENNITCFIDRVDISGGEEFSPRLAEEIKKSTIFLFLGSENSYTATWTPKELHFAVKHKEKVAIIPYLIDDKNIPLDIELLVLDLNIRNIKDHPIETVLVEDIKSALEKLAPKTGKEDLSMVKSVIESIISSQHTKQYNIDLLTHLGEFNWNKRFRSSSEANRPKEAKEYFRSAVQLSRELYGPKRFGEDRQVADLFAVIADIEKESNHPDDAEKNYNEAIQRYRCNGTRSSLRKEPLIDCLLSLVEIRIKKKEFSLAEEHCLEIKDLLSGSRRVSLYSISQKALKLCELWGEILREQGKGIEAVNLYDEVLSLFRNNDKREANGFGKMLFEFAKSSIKNGDLANAERYLKEAISLDNEYLDALLELARLYKRMDIPANAISTYNQCFELVMKNSFLDYTFATRTEDVVREVAKYFNSVKRYDEVDNCFLLAIAKFKVDLFTAKTSSARIGNLYEPYADWLFDHKRYSEALSFLKECEQLVQMPNAVSSPTEKRFWLAAKKTRCLFLIGMEKVAMSCLKTALDNSRDALGSSDTVSMFYNVAKMLRSSHLNLAVNFIKQFVIDNCLSIEEKNRDGLSMYYTHLGWFLMDFEEYQYARKPLEKALELSSKEDRPNALNNLGRLYASIGLYAEAEKLLREAFTYLDGADKKDPQALAGLAENQSYMGLLYLNQGNPAAATVYLEKALSNYKEYSRTSDSRKEDIEQTERWLEKAKANL